MRMHADRSTKIIYEGTAQVSLLWSLRDGCDVNAMFNSVASTLPIAAATGRSDCTAQLNRATYYYR